MARAAAATSRPRPSSSASNRAPAIPKTPVPSTPARSKTPSSSRPKTPSAKTPSSGLFAPTAASLARSRNAPSPVPTPVKRHSLGPDVAERLSKPTASSISKARAPTLASPPRPTAAKTSATRGDPSKIAKTTAKPKVAGTAKAKATAAKAAEPDVPTSPEDLHPEIEDEHSEIEDTQEVDIEREREGSATTSATLVDAAPLVQEPETHDVFDKPIVHDEPEEHVEEHHDLTPEASVVESEASVEPESVDPVTEHHAPDVVTPHHDDLLDIVNMLESKPLISAQLVTSSTTVKPGQLDMDEIPDIDEY
ncbi:hypothetical protein EUX98_g1943 [Antrodiella citrinella]|uniref:Uncharacterized protein n=1 Tax=Antrodiella citrinella TaxID=2447956 RepID=A0A4S4N8J8_9APHY|nr:hypothetical protein EUX98_g1943 [Antrodiella citrinella]